MLTIRQFLKRRKRALSAIYVAGWAAILAAVLVYKAKMNLNLAEIILVAIAGTIAMQAFIAQAAVVVLMRFLTLPCPRCGKSLRQLPRALVRKVAKELASKEGIAACPHCGASFDVPMPP